MKKFYCTLVTILFLCANVKASDFYLRTGIGVITLPGSWTNSSNGVGGTSPLNFAGTHTWHFANRASTNFSAQNFTIAATATAIIESGFNLTVSSTAAFTNAFKMQIANTGTLTISRNTNYNFDTLFVNSCVIYNTASYNVKAVNISGKTITYGNVIINASVDLNGNSGDFHINGLLTIGTSQVLDLSSNNLFLNGSNGSIAGAGEIMGDATSNILFNNGNGGNNGTLRFASGGRMLSQFVMTYLSGNSYITLGSELSLDLLIESTGGIDLNGNTLIMNAGGDISFPTTSGDGMIKGSAASRILINSASVGAFTTGKRLFMDPSFNSLRSLLYNNTGTADTLKLGSALNIIDSIAVINGTVTTGGFLTLKADNVQTAMVAPLNGTDAILDNVTVETIVKGGFTGWANIGANGVTTASVSDLESQIPMVCEGCPYGTMSLGSYFESIQGWEEGKDLYDTSITYTTPLDPGRGFWVYLGDGPNNTNDLTWSFTGPLAQGTITYSLGSAASGMNLVSNPYASPISWAAVVNDSGILPDLYIWNADLNGGAGGTSYWNQVVTSPAGSGANDVIPAGQGFYIDNNGANAPDIVFKEASKLDANTYAANPVLRSSQPTGNAPGNYFRLKLTNPNKENDETVILVKNNASLLRDRYDSKKIFGSPGYLYYPGSYDAYTSISTKDASGADYAIQTIPSLNYSVSIPVLVRTFASGSHTISAFDYAGYGGCIVIKDRQDNSYHDLKKGSYICNISATDTSTRFEMIICENGVVPSSIKEAAVSSNIFINKDANGAYVQTKFDVSTKATISVYNIVGQQLVNDIKVEGIENTTRLDINLHNQVVLVKVVTDNETVTKKVVLE